MATRAAIFRSRGLHARRHAIAGAASLIRLACQACPLRAASTSTATAAQDRSAGSAPCPRYDVVVVGGGIVGSALACYLKSSALFRGKKVAVIESALPPKSGTVEEDSPDLRVYTISPASKKVLESAQVWDKMPIARIASFKDMQAWDAMGNGFIRFNSETAGHKTLGYVIESKVLVRAVHDRMKELTAANEEEDPAPLQLYCPAKLKHYQRPTSISSLSEIGLEDGTRMKADVVVAADGANSIVRTLTALGTWGWDYDQQAVVATIKTEVPNATAWQRFFPTGPLAVLPMRDGYSSIVWSCSKDMAEDLTSMTSEQFVARLNEALFAPPNVSPSSSFPGIPVLKDLVKGVNDALNSVMTAAAMADPFVAPPKPVELVGRRMSFPLKMRHATSYVKPGVALVGDSAHSIHPLAGQGLNLGLADVQCLSDLLLDGVKSGANFSDVHFLSQYEDARKRANVTMAMAMDGFKRMFGPTPDAVAVARNVGMGTLNAVEPLKNKIMRYAMGL